MRTKEALDGQRLRDPENVLLSQAADQIASLDQVLLDFVGLAESKSNEQFLDLRQALSSTLQSLSELKQRLYQSASEQERVLCSRCQSIIVGYATHCPRCGCAKAIEAGVEIPTEPEIELNPELTEFEQLTRECFESGENYQDWLRALHVMHSKYSGILDGLEDSELPDASLLNAWTEMENGLSLVVDSLTILVEYTDGEFGIEDFELLWGHIKAGFAVFQSAARTVESDIVNSP